MFDRGLFLSVVCCGTASCPRKVVSCGIAALRHCFVQSVRALGTLVAANVAAYANEECIVPSHTGGTVIWIKVREQRRAPLGVAEETNRRRPQPTACSSIEVGDRQRSTTNFGEVASGAAEGGFRRRPLPAALVVTSSRGRNPTKRGLVAFQPGNPAQRK